MPDPATAENEEFGIILSVLGASLAEEPNRWTNIAAGIKGSRMEVLAGAGHPIPIEKPRELAGSMNAFLAT